MADFDEERDTGVPCPKCSGAGELVLDKREHADGSYSIRKMQCDLCMGATVVSVMRMRAFKIAQHVDASDK